MEVCKKKATEEQLHAQAVIKDCHRTLREKCKIIGAEQAWQQHLQNETKIQEYASAMHKLSNIWDSNIGEEHNGKVSRCRVLWSQQYCMEYFYAKPVPVRLTKREREYRMLEKCPELQWMVETINLQDETPDPLRVLDVGSCFNPFAGTPHFDVTAIDLCPATPDVLRGDILQLPVEDGIEGVTYDENRKEILALPALGFNCVIFSLLLEYMPSSEQRLNCCRKAYRLLQTEGLLLIITPDSQHVGKNARLMKNWRYTLATLGFTRVRFDKLPHITCMAFRKAILPDLAERWAANYHAPYMTATIEIPQDNNSQDATDE